MAKKYLQLSKILKKLLFEKDMRASDLAKKLNIPPPTINRIVNGESTRPYASSLEPIAKFFNIKVKQLIGEEPLFINNFESKLIDENSIRSIPVKHWDSLRSNLSTNELSGSIAVAHVSKNSFALFNPDSSMEPLFQKSSILIFDPTEKVTDRSFAIVKLEKLNIYVFRQILFDLNQIYIKALNPDIINSSIKILCSQDEIIAKLVECRINYE